MADVLNRTTKQYLRSVNEPDYPQVDWIWSPDVSALAGVPTKYWNISGDLVTEMTQAEKDAVDAAEQSARVAAIKTEVKARFDQSENSDKAIILMMIDEINILRSALHQLKTELKPAALNNPLTYNTGTERTPAQARTAFQNKVDIL